MGGADIPGFNICLMRSLANTVGPGDAFRPIMACHYSEEGDDQVCIGYVAKEGWSNLSVRMMAMEGRLNIAAVLEAAQGLDLWSDFYAMLDAYEEAQDE